MGYAPYLLAMVLLAIGVYAIACKRNLIKVIIGVMVAEYAVNLFLVLLGYRTGGHAPIMQRAADPAFAHGAVDPLPQAMVLTAIVIGLGVLALMTAIALRLYQSYGTYDITQIRKLRG